MALAPKFAGQKFAAGSVHATHTLELCKYSNIHLLALYRICGMVLLSKNKQNT